ncbi:MAG: hypothetical protein EOP53_05715 [Sphingobacteriales bacterium]|nr:MAG: hypothetical protein EOP53_05715 [Sphingobacteriales bacterium]
MVKKLLVILIFVLELYSCENISNKIKNQVDNSLQDAEKELISDLGNSKDIYNKNYNSALQSSTDANYINKLKNLDSTVNTTSKYLDSLLALLKKYDDYDPNNISEVKRIFVTEGVGDSIFFKVKATYSYAEKIAISDSSKMSLRKVRETYNEETKKLYFLLTGLIIQKV